MSGCTQHHPEYQGNFSRDWIVSSQTQLFSMALNLTRALDCEVGENRVDDVAKISE